MPRPAAHPAPGTRGRIATLGTKRSVRATLPLLSVLALLAASAAGCDPDLDPGPVRAPLTTHLQLWQPGDRYYYGTYSVTDADATVLDVTPNAESWFSGDSGLVYAFAYHTPAVGDATFILQVDLPAGYAPDLHPGDRVTVTARTEELWIREAEAEVRAPDGTLLFAYYTGPFRDQHGPLDQLPRQRATLACGAVAYPRLTYEIDGPLLAPPVEVALYQGDITEVDTPAGRYAALLARATDPLDEACEDQAGIEEVALLRLPALAE
jgi:hypothetical protein